MEGFVGEEEELEVDLVLDREPMEQYRGDIFTGAGVGEKAGSRALDVLKFIEDF